MASPRGTRKESESQDIIVRYSSVHRRFMDFVQDKEKRMLEHQRRSAAVDREARLSVRRASLEIRELAGDAAKRVEEERARFAQAMTYEDSYVEEDETQDSQDFEKVIQPQAALQVAAPQAAFQEKTPQAALQVVQSEVRRESRGTDKYLNWSKHGSSMDVEIVSAVIAAGGVPSEARSAPHGAIGVFWADIAKQMEGSHFFAEQLHILNGDSVQRRFKALRSGAKERHAMSMASGAADVEYDAVQKLFDDYEIMVKEHKEKEVRVSASESHKKEQRRRHGEATRSASNNFGSAGGTEKNRDEDDDDEPAPKKARTQSMVDIASRLVGVVERHIEATAVEPMGSTRQRVEHVENEIIDVKNSLGRIEAMLAAIARSRDN